MLLLSLLRGILPIPTVWLTKKTPALQQPLLITFLLQHCQVQVGHRFSPASTCCFTFYILYLLWYSLLLGWCFQILPSTYRH